MAKQMQQMSGGGGFGARRIKTILYALFGIIALVVFVRPTVMVAGVGLMPSLAAWIIDRTQQKYAFFCVSGLNFCGTFPYLLELWSGNHTTAGATKIISDVFALTVMYGTASFGWMVFLIVPPVIASFTTAITERRLAALQTTQEELVKEWGQEVTVAAPAQPVMGPADMAMPGPPGGEMAPATPPEAEPAMAAPTPGADPSAAGAPPAAPAAENA